MIAIPEPALPAVEGPTELRAALKPDAPVEVHRNLECPRYDDCLDVAVARGWASWSCARCPLLCVRPPGDPVAVEAQSRRGPSIFVW